MTPDEVVKELKEISEEWSYPAGAEFYPKKEALQSAITFLQDYQKLRERVSVEKIEIAMELEDTDDKRAQAIVTYLRGEK
jgi:hypothetical protein